MKPWMVMRSYYFPGEREKIRRARRRAIAWTLLISALIFTIVGYLLRYEQTEGSHRNQVAQLQEKIDYYRGHWTPIRETPVRARVK